VLFFNEKYHFKKLNFILPKQDKKLRKAGHVLPNQDASCRIRMRPAEAGHNFLKSGTQFRSKQDKISFNP
jgi:hypothetical protein